MRVQYRWTYWFLLVCLLLPDCACAQDTTPSPAYELQPIFSDDFSKDTRADYTIAGDVSWESGRLTLPGDASIGRAIKAGAWARVHLTLERPELTAAQPESDVQIWFELADGATPCFVSLRRTLTDEGQTVTVALFDTVERDGKPISVLVREATLDIAATERLVVEYRYGLVHVWAEEIAVLVAHIQNGSAAVAGFRVTGSRTYLNLNHISASSIPAPAELTAEQQEQRAKAVDANTELMELSAQGKFAEAASIGEEVLLIRRAVLGEQHTATATSLNNLALLHESQSNYSAAEPLYQRALKIRETVLGPDHLGTGESLNNLAMLYDLQGNYAAAEPMKLRTLKILEQVLGPSHSDTATLLNNLAESYKSQANYAAAEPLCLRALKIKETTLGPDHSDTATSLNNLAELYRLQGNYAAAEPLALRALKIKEKALGPDHSDTARSLSNLAVLYESQGNYAASEPLKLRTIKIYGKSLGPNHPETATSLNNLAELYRVQGNYAAAEPLYQRALSIYENTLGPDHPSTAGSLNNLAELYRAQRKYTAAEPLYQRALKIHEKSLGPDHPRTALSLNNMAELYRAQGNAAAAEPLHQRALKIHEETLGPEHPDTAQSLSNLAMLQWDRDQAEAAALLAERAVKIRLRHLDQTAAIQTEQQQFLMSRTANRDISIWLTISGAQAPGTPVVYRDVLAWKGLITARQQGLRQALKDDPLFANFRGMIRQLSTVSLSPPLPPSDPTAIESWKARESELRRNWESRKIMLEAEHELLEKELAVHSVAFRETLEERRVQPEDLAATLKAQDRPTALIDILEYHYFGRTDKGEKNERRIAAFVVYGDQPVVRVELGSAEEISRQVTLWRESIGQKVADQDSGEELRKLVWLPLELHLEGIETILISPDGPLAQLAWGALPGEQPNSYLLEDRALVVIPVPQMLPSLLREGRRTGPPESLLLAGDIEYGGDPGQPSDLLAKRDAAGRPGDGGLTEFAKLSAAQGELASIRDWYENADATGTVKVLRKENATESAFREQASQHQWLHVITHGFFAPESVHSATQSTEDDVALLHQSDPHHPVRGENPGLLSGLAFAGANTPPGPEKDDGILTSLEVAALDLNQVDTVVLSACETGLGAVAGGEGLRGLQSAFQVAGAKTCVASLWKVPDAATARLMQRFYENLWDRQLGKLEALREAQLWMMKDQSARGAEIVNESPENTRLPPLYWAAFVLSGDWR